MWLHQFCNIPLCSDVCWTTSWERPILLYCFTELFRFCTLLEVVEIHILLTLLTVFWWKCSDWLKSNSRVCTRLTRTSGTINQGSGDQSGVLKSMVWNGSGLSWLLTDPLVPAWHLSPEMFEGLFGLQTEYHRVWNNVLSLFHPFPSMAALVECDLDGCPGCALFWGVGAGGPAVEVVS